jgi:hypothetical protein
MGCGPNSSSVSTAAARQTRHDLDTGEAKLIPVPGTLAVLQASRQAFAKLT